MANSMSNNDLIPLDTRQSNMTDNDSDYEELPTVDIEYEETDDSSPSSGCECHSFSKIHSPPLSFKDPKVNMLVPGRAINVKIVDVERSPATHIINPNLYVLQLQHGQYEWTVRKRYKHFQHLHQQLRIFRTTLSIPIPTKRHKARRKSCRNIEKSRLPRFPKRPDALLPHDKIEHRVQQLEEYLKNVLRIPLYRNHPEMMEFLEISPLSFICDLGKKNKEGIVQKRSGGHRTTMGCFRLKRGFIDWCGRWRWRWLIVKDSWIAYIKPKDGRVRCVLLMDQGFHVESGFLSTGIHHGLQISNLTRHLLVRCWTKRKSREWTEALLNTSKTEGRDFTQPNRYDAFAPVRNNNECRWFIDGATYFEAVAEALEKAKEEIFIADWWLSPEIYMKRPVIQGEIWRLDHILKRKAQQGVKVFVLLYKEVEFALGINSQYSKQQLVNMHPNIKVLRHPDHVKNGTLLWAHHEKIVCIDQTYAFLGGIDLCYGRWDDYQHRLTDLGGMGKKLSQGTLAGDVKTSAVTVGSPVLRRSHSLSEIASELGANFQSERWKFVRLSLLPQPTPFFTADEQLSNNSEDHPVKIKVEEATPTSSQIITPSSEEKSLPNDKEYSTSHLRAVDNEECAKKRFTSRKLKAKRVMQAVVRLQGLKKQSHNKSLDSLSSTVDNLDLPDADMRRTTSEVALNELGLQGSPKLWIGKDYINFIIKDFEHLHKPYQDLIDRHTTPRMPWHDIGLFVQGSAARDVARHFIQRWNFYKFEKAKYYDRYPWLLPKSYQDCDSVQPLQISSTNKLFCANCQVLRSVSTWSGGIKTMEQSIHTAYIETIRNAKHYVYIENQFFITQAVGHKDVLNGIGEALFQRIIEAHRNRENFRVYVVMPLLPAFEGEIGTGTGTAIQAITHWNYASMCRGPGSLYQRLLKEVGDPNTYITFYGLRTHGLLNEKIITELVYVHSKLLIADDKTVIIGSANINDRSLLGNRDSEICMIIEDSDFEKAVMDGKPYDAGRYACSLRRTLFREHLGLLDKNSRSVDVRDPVSESFYKDVWIRTAALNTSVYEKVFRCIPSDEVRNFVQLKEYLSKPSLAVSDPDSASQLLGSVQGHLVLMPFFFLCDENLTPSAGTKESLMPVCLWT
ncbi:LOW QUALITY PROTEIN: phospholipase D1-like [Uloborus diversus]|uniref:LOW QUALITY PROTEIN: phospholipase D1-like n=1 Tax=Uloborus diversus TaxID=327109 RepID=UPI0024091103|nr:LOW QUALITY PROTEIN: phospholipase D1-like [Uloborus diversus]